MVRRVGEPEEATPGASDPRRAGAAGTETLGEAGDRYHTGVDGIQKPPMNNEGRK